MHKVIVIAGFKGGVGKSTIADRLAEMLDNSLVISLDFYQDAVEYNSSKTVNLSQEENLNSYLSKNKNNIKYFIIDAGGFNDKRLSTINIDLLIIPTKSGYRSIKTSVDSLVTLSPLDVPIMFILNDYMQEKELQETINILEEILHITNLDLEKFYLFGITHSNAIKTCENKNASLAELSAQSAFLANSYKKVIQRFKELADEVADIVG